MAAEKGASMKGEMQKREFNEQHSRRTEMVYSLSSPGCHGALVSPRQHLVIIAVASRLEES